jgi:predicted nuclease of predicted toxin-antitoxin system
MGRRPRVAAGRRPRRRLGRRWPADPGDEEILARALAEGRVLVTLDKDFGELAVLRGLPHAGILRLVGLSALQQANVTLQVVEAHAADLAAGAFITAEGDRIRVRVGGESETT